jgi:hypothetical protein
MKIENREELTAALVSRVIENAPIRELIRVYGEAVTAAINDLTEEDLIQSIASAGYIDITEKYISDESDSTQEG